MSDRLEIIEHLEAKIRRGIAEMQSNLVLEIIFSH